MNGLWVSMLKNYFILFTFFYLNLNFYQKKYLNIKVFLLIFLLITLVIILSGERVATFIFSIYSIFLFLNFRDKFNLFKVFPIH